MPLRCALVDSPGRVALTEVFPELHRRLPWRVLGEWPTPVHALPRPQALAGGAGVFVKREDLSSPHYGGNKVRTLESHLGRAVHRGAERIWATGAYGSNHSVATLVHGARVGLGIGAALFPQVHSLAAALNLDATIATNAELVDVAHVAYLPAAFATLRLRRPRDYLMTPGGATPGGALGHVSAALELATQVARGELPRPRRLVLAVGSTCTTAGLLVGLRIARRLGIGLSLARPLTVHAVRVTPWPVTSPVRIIALARRTSELLAGMLGEVAEVHERELASDLRVETRYLGRGYGRNTAAAQRAHHALDDAGCPPTDPVYTSKSAAALVDLAARETGPIVYWMTKSSAPLPVATHQQRERAPRRMRHWLRSRSGYGT